MLHTGRYPHLDKALTQPNSHPPPVHSPLPSCSGAFFDPLDDCVVPSFDAELRPIGGDRHMDGAASVQVRTAACMLLRGRLARAI